MTYLRKRDYFTSIREADLDVILEELSQTTPFTPTQVRQENELEAQEKVSAMIRHRYDVRKIFYDILTYSDTTQFNENDLVEYTEGAYSDASTYSIGDRVSYSFVVSNVTVENIYVANTNITVAEPFDATKWDAITENASLYICRRPSLGNKPGTDFGYDTNLFTGNHDTILGWDKSNTLYLKRDDQHIKLYFSASDRSNDANSVGIVPFEPKPKVFPTNIPIEEGVDKENSVHGDLSIIGFINDGTEWEVTPSLFWEKGDNRSPLVKGIVVDIALFDIHGLINPRNIPDFIGEKRDNAMDILKKMQKGQISPDLPIFYDEEKGQSISFGSNRKNSYTMFQTGHNDMGHNDKPGDRNRIQ